MAKDSRIGESLWFIWDGYGYDFLTDESIVFYTEDHIDIEEDVVRKALASSIQREGISHSLSDGFTLIASGIFGHYYSGYSLISERYSICNKDGITEDGEQLDSIVPITVVEVFDVI